MTDRTTKILLAAIAIGLWANIGMTVFRPVTAMAQQASANDWLESIDSRLEQIAFGTCKNQKICGN